jgi:hypothetical protein
MATLAEYRAREHWSFSALNPFVNICALQFAFDRIYRLPKALTPVTLAFGSAFHGRRVGSPGRPRPRICSIRSGPGNWRKTGTSGSTRTRTLRAAPARAGT